MKGSLRLNSLWLRVLLHAAQVCVYEPAPVYTKLTTNARGMRRCARRGKTGINLTTVDRTGGVILGSKDGIDVTITVRPPGRRHDPSSEQF